MSAEFGPELDFAVAVAREAGAVLRENYGKVHEVGYKGRIDLVTEMDRRSESLIIGRIRNAFPGDAVWAEESGRDLSGSERVWIVDPLDGTTNYAHEYPVFAVSIALQVAGRLRVGVVLNPLLGDVYAARQGGGATLNGHTRRVTDVEALDRAFLATGFGYDVSTEPNPERNNLGPFSRFIVRAQAVRRAGSAALAIAKVGVGRTDGFWELGLHAWDMAAAMLIVEEGGGRITNSRGGPVELTARELVASNGRIHEAMLGVLAARDGSTAGAADGGRPRAAMPSEQGDPPPPESMRGYVMGFLYTGPNPPATPEAADDIQRAHLANIGRLQREGKIVIVGPFLDGGDLRGMFLFDTTSIEEARDWCDTDPAVRAGVFRVELHPWYGAKGI